jgi:hypothetical protein
MPVGIIVKRVKFELLWVSICRRYGWVNGDAKNERMKKP